MYLKIRSTQKKTGVGFKKKKSRKKVECLAQYSLVKHTPLNAFTFKLYSLHILNMSDASRDR